MRDTVYVYFNNYKLNICVYIKLQCLVTEDFIRFVLVERYAEFKLEFIYLISRKLCGLILYNCEMHPFLLNTFLKQRPPFYLLNFSINSPL